MNNNMIKLKKVKYTTDLSTLKNGTYCSQHKVETSIRKSWYVMFNNYFFSTQKDNSWGKFGTEEHNRLKQFDLTEEDKEILSQIK